MRRGGLLLWGFINPDCTSDGGWPMRIHFCVPAHKNSNNKWACLEMGLGLGKLVCVIGVCGVCDYACCVCCMWVCVLCV